MSEMDELEFKRWMKRVSERSGEGIKNSEVYMGVASMDYMKEPQCALELGIAIMLDKPIALLVMEGVKIPENLRKVAVAVETCDPDNGESVTAASMRLMEKFDTWKREKILMEETK